MRGDQKAVCVCERDSFCVRNSSFSRLPSRLPSCRSVSMSFCPISLFFSWESEDKNAFRCVQVDWTLNSYGRVVFQVSKSAPPNFSKPSNTHWSDFTFFFRLCFPRRIVANASFVPEKRGTHKACMGQREREQESKKKAKAETKAPFAFFFTPTHAPLFGGIDDSSLACYTYRYGGIHPTPQSSSPLPTSNSISSSSRSWRAWQQQQYLPTPTTTQTHQTADTSS